MARSVPLSTSRGGLELVPRRRFLCAVSHRGRTLGVVFLCLPNGKYPTISSAWYGQFGLSVLQHLRQARAASIG